MKNSRILVFFPFINVTTRVLTQEVTQKGASEGVVASRMSPPGKRSAKVNGSGDSGDSDNVRGTDCFSLRAFLLAQAVLCFKFLSWGRKIFSSAPAVARNPKWRPVWQPKMEIF